MKALTEEQVVKMMIGELTASSERCPPHSFVPSWALPEPGTTDDDHETVPASLCTSCGQVRLMMIGR